MTNTDTPSPALSIVVASSDEHRSLEQTLTAIEKQIGSRAVELIVATDNSAHARLVRERFAHVTLIESDQPRLVPELWGMGMTRARGQWIAVTMASVIPSDDWVETLLCPRDNDCAAIGGAIENARNATWVDWAVYFVRYTSFMLPFRASNVTQVAADNAAYRQSAIADQMDWIATNGFWEAEVNNRLVARGKFLQSDPRLVVRYANAFSISGFARQRLMHGRIFGRMRAAKSTATQRAMYIATSPAIPFVYLVRILRNVASKKRNRLAFALALPLTIFFLLCWGTSEFLRLIADGKSSSTARQFDSKRA